MAALPVIHDRISEEEAAMTVTIIEETPDALLEYERVSIAFRVTSRFRVESDPEGTKGFMLVEEPVTPYIKDYDQEPQYRPSAWHKWWDISSCLILSAFMGEERIGGAMVAWKTAEIPLLATNADLACLLDIRVDPNHRGVGIGHLLFSRVLEWSRARGIDRLLIETQNNNVAACRFYARHKCELGSINREAYAGSEYAEEVQLLWYRNVISG